MLPRQLVTVLGSSYAKGLNPEQRCSLEPREKEGYLLPELLPGINDHLRSLLVYLNHHVGPGMFLYIVLQKKKKNITFQSTHFTRKPPRKILRLNLELVNAMDFRSVLGMMRG